MDPGHGHCFVLVADLKLSFWTLPISRSWLSCVLDVVVQCNDAKSRMFSVDIWFWLDEVVFCPERWEAL